MCFALANEMPYAMYTIRSEQIHHVMLEHYQMMAVYNVHIIFTSMPYAINLQTQVSTSFGRRMLNTDLPMQFTLKYEM